MEVYASSARIRGNDMASHGSPSAILTARFTWAVEYACAIHAAQLRKGTNVPYICHLLGVSALVIEAEGDEEQAIAGLLHDAAEDAGGEARLTDIEARFGSRVTRIVRACSDATDVEWKKATPYWERKLGYLSRLQMEPEECVLVSIADKVHNSRAILTDLQLHGPDVTLAKFTSSSQEMLRYYATCLSIAEGKDISRKLTLPLRTALRDIAELIELPVPDPVKLGPAA